MSEDRFTQADWTAGTVNQTVNNIDGPDLSTLSLEQKVDLIVRKIVGSPWYNEPGIMPTLQLMRDGQLRALYERRMLFAITGVLVLGQLYILGDVYFF
jgi:hypothetical protein